MNNLDFVSPKRCFFVSCFPIKYLTYDISKRNANVRCMGKMNAMELSIYIPPWQHIIIEIGEIYCCTNLPLETNSCIHS